MLPEEKSESGCILLDLTDDCRGPGGSGAGGGISAAGGVEG